MATTQAEVYDVPEEAVEGAPVALKGDLPHLPQLPDMEVQESMQLPRYKPPIQVPNHCPFGCTSEQLTELGYCKHLVGFTNQKMGARRYEPITPFLDRFGNETGSFQVRGDAEMLKRTKTGDKFVNPQDSDEKGRVWYRWNSWRVYRPDPEQRSLACP